MAWARSSITASRRPSGDQFTALKAVLPWVVSSSPSASAAAGDAVGPDAQAANAANAARASTTTSTTAD
jgi:hypothetical protein